MKILFYGNGSSGNHGCEAIVNGSAELFGKSNEYIVYSENMTEDLHYSLQSIAKCYPAKNVRKRNFDLIKAYAKLKLTGDYTDMDGLYYLQGIKKGHELADVAFSVGGDNYCYGGTEHYAYLNRAYHQNGMRTVLWGCSIEPEIVIKPSVTKDLCLYDFIVARESITYNAIQKVTDRVVLAPDPAFFMSPEICEVDQRLLQGTVIGINASPLIMKYEGTAGMAYENYRQLLKHILENTDATIALIPHVVWESNDDRKVLKQLFEDFEQDERIVLVEDHTAPQLKYIISLCDFFVGARTHATIAAYSSCVPTLVVGYSVKARGIAKDLFGSDNGYVLPVQSLKSSDELVSAFQRLYEKRETIAEGLKREIPEYKNSAIKAKQAVEDLIKA